MQLCSQHVVSAVDLIPSLLFMGLGSSFTHCVGMCSPFVLAQQRSFSKGCLLSRLRQSALFPYHIGRMTTYVTIATLANMALKFVLLSPALEMYVRASLLLVAALMFLAMALPLLQKLFPALSKLSFPAAIPILQRQISKLQTREGFWPRYCIGLLLGLLPCGMVMGAVLAASSANTLWHTALAMTVFAVGTMPGLIVIGWGGQALRNLWPQAAKKSHA